MLHSFDFCFLNAAAESNLVVLNNGTVARVIKGSQILHYENNVCFHGDQLNFVNVI